MKQHAILPDPSPPGLRRLTYGIFCWLNRNPRVWRFFAAVLRRWPFLGNLVPMAASHFAVTHLLRRTDCFSSTSHEPNLLAGAYMIGMDAGPEYERDKAVFDAVVPTPAEVRHRADQETRRLLAQIAPLAAPGGFDLIEDYLIWIVLRATEAAFGDAAESMQAGQPANPGDLDLQRKYLHELRHVAAQLFAGSMAPADVIRRAEAAAHSLQSRVAGAFGHIRVGEWAQKCPFADRATLTRSAIGLAWVSHPVTVQSAALVVQELLGRGEVHRGLRDRAMALGQQVWTDPDFRAEVRLHVTEMMRFRPVFPLLSRDVPRDTTFEAGGRWRPACRAGSSVQALTIGALFDQKAVAEAPRYRPHRDWGRFEDARLMMFGYGKRQCPGREQALEMMTSAVMGLLTLPGLAWDRSRSDRFMYDGPLITRMRLRAD